MKTLLFVLIGMLLITSAQSQVLLVQKGQKIQVESILYANPLPYDSKWGKLKQEKKDELVLDLNNKIESGIEAPWRTTIAKFEVIDVKTGNGAAAFTIKAYDSGFEYESTSYMTEDTMYGVRNIDPLYSIVDGDTIGMAIQGIQRIPNKLKQYDKLPPYEDFSFTFPKTWTGQMSEEVFAGRRTDTHHEFGYFQDSETGEYSIGNFKVTSTSNIYNIINHSVDITEYFTNSTINYYVAYCSGTEEIEIGGKIQVVYIIESEKWSTSKMNREYNAEQQDLANKASAEFDKFVEKMSKKTAKRGYTNPDGFVISYWKEWFLPSFGIVKSESYDMYGAIQSRNKVVF